MRILSFDVGTRNFALCLLDTKPLHILRWEVIDTQAENHLKPKDVKNIESKKRALLSSLCRRHEQLAAALGSGDSVVIEQQPNGRYGSPTMNILAHTIGTYFLLQHDAATPPFTVRQVAAKTKLRVNPEEWGAEDRPQEEAPASAPVSPGGKRNRQDEYRRYKHNKGRGVEVCTAILSARSEFAAWRELFESSPKKDDLADALLQALSQLDATEYTAAGAAAAAGDGAV